jgi:hypothetical protein
LTSSGARTAYAESLLNMAIAGLAPIVETRVDGNVLHIAGEDRATTTDGRRDRIDLDLAVIARDRGEIRIPTAR